MVKVVLKALWQFCGYRVCSAEEAQDGSGLRVKGSRL